LGAFATVHSATALPVETNFAGSLVVP